MVRREAKAGTTVAMPLDLGAVTEATPDFAVANTGGLSGVTSTAADAAANIGAELRAAREFRGLSLQELADATRIRRSYLAALEELKLDQLPSRPFTVGYVRAYAQAMNMDADRAVARFKADAPETVQPLRAPIGVIHERDPRLTLVAGAAAVVLSAVLVWNLVQHAVAEDGAPTPAVPEMSAPSGPQMAAAQTPVMLGPSQPAPQESEVPAPYVTPGLTPVDPVAASVAGVDSAAGALAPVRAAFNPRGSIYGASPEQSVVTLQARKTASLIIRGKDGAVYFARQLAAGESYRAPMLQGLTIDVSDPGAFDVYANGELRGALPTPQTQLARLAG